MSREASTREAMRFPANCRPRGDGKGREQPPVEVDVTAETGGERGGAVDGDDQQRGAREAAEISKEKDEHRDDDRTRRRPVICRGRHPTAVAA